MCTLESCARRLEHNWGVGTINSFAPTDPWCRQTQDQTLALSDPEIHSSVSAISQGPLQLTPPLKQALHTKKALLWEGAEEQLPEGVAQWPSQGHLGTSPCDSLEASLALHST